MCHALLRDATLYDVLLKVDRDLAAEAKAARCSCGGTLHSARYPRKPRGGPDPLDPEYGHRLSFCCAVDGCRQRVTPPSVRYLGRRVYLGVDDHRRARNLRPAGSESVALGQRLR